MQKRVIITNETPNDQGSIVLNSAIDLTRFAQNPIMLYNHDWETLIGHWEDVQFDGKNWTAIPVFSDIESIKEIKKLWAEGNLKSASIGGAVKYKTDQFDKELQDNKGNRIVEKFYIYEISIVPIPSNPDATTLSTKIYNEKECIYLNSKFMAKKDKQGNDLPEDTVEQKAEEIKPVAPVEPVKETPPPPQKTHVILKTIKEIAGNLLALVSNHDEPDGDEAVKTTNLPLNPPEIGAVEGSAKLEAEALEKVKNCNNCSQLEAMEMESGLPEVVKKAIETRKSELKAKEAEEKSKKEPEKKETEKVQNKSFKKMETPELKTPVELAAEKIVEPPKKQTVIMGTGKTLTELRATPDVRKMIEKLSAGGSSDINERIVFLEAMLADRKYNAVIDKMRFVTNATDGMLKQAKNIRPTGDVDAKKILTALRQQMVTMGSSADALTTPETTAVEWLSLVLFKLFPSAGWKSEISIFGAEDTGNNLGVIWTNIAAAPGVNKGSKPSPADYTYTDTAVSLKMVNYWLDPMLWTPLSMHLLRYDQMATGWEQGLVTLRTEIDNDLIYTLAALVPAASILSTTGKAFNIASATDLDQFVLNTAFVGSLAKPVLDDALRIQQLFSKQNFPDGTKHVLVMDPTAERYITADPETKSLLTRFVNSSGDELVGYKNSMFRNRSKVAIYDPVTAAVIDPAGAIPVTTVGANLAFIPDQVGIGLGKFDVFMVQDPAKYGYRMSCDVRMGIQPLRANFYGTALLVYGTPGL